MIDAERGGAVSDYCQVVTTTDSRDEAERLARGAVQSRHAACAQIVGPVTSVYRWQGAIEDAQEWQVWLKTTTAAYGDLETYLRQAHSYDVPEILCLPIVGGHGPYLQWLADETQAGS
jgi:periplasmic divalent cation tolerance protein